ncbi:MAG: isocitrate lyase/phosphoenolpyruvate mutase family protein [Alphaproteobacteria bacterium]|nr:MAG: isocitrate lyase/phosphoenolpyruvate mutase family protein [Alphaproteobacteria bacterium]
MPRPSVADKRRTFRKLHVSGCWMIPNPWDVGSARYLQGLGFQALATTSSGFAWSVAHADNAVPRDMVLAHIAEIVGATDVPVNADFEGGYADEPAGVAESVRLCCETGVAGLSIEDSTGNKDQPLYDIPFAVERMKAARAAIDKAGADVMLTGRAEGFIAGVPDLAQMIARLKAYAAAGADVLYAPGIRTREQIEAVCQAVAPKPVNFLNGAAFGHSVNDLAAMGVRRISVGGALARSAWGGFTRMAKEIAGEGTFTGFKDAASGAELNAFFTKDKAARGA